MKPGLGLGLLAHTVTLELKEPRQENHELEVAEQDSVLKQTTYLGRNAIITIF